MGISFEPVTTADGRGRLAALADEIWHEYWPALIGAAQTDYMVEQFQSLTPSSATCASRLRVLAFARQ